MELPFAREECNEATTSRVYMFFRSFRRPGRLWRWWLRLAPFLSFSILSFDLILTIAINHRSVRIPPSTTLTTDLSLSKDRVFIASMHWNNESIIRRHWKDGVLDLVRHYGADNVYISIIEGGSWDDTKGALTALDFELGKLGVERSIEMDYRTHEDEIERIPDQHEQGWIWTSSEKKELRRIPYLAGIRLVVDDVIFTTEDVTTLIGTRGGNFAAVCSLDFSHPPLYYDTFALRDISGAKTVTQTWPFFLAAQSRNAIISNSPMPVKSCWNGIVVFQADPFYNDPPLRFRGIPDSLALRHLEGSECCLFYAGNWLSSLHGVWLNPNVRVSYNLEASKRVNGESGSWPSRTEKLVGIWSNRLARLTGFPQRLLERYVVNRRIRIWRDANREGQRDNQEDGAYCMINEMQVVTQNGWTHL